MDNWQARLQMSGLKITPQRLLILRALEGFGEESHPGAEDIWQAVSEKEPNISRATVYRNLRRLVDSGLVNELYFRDGKARYELNLDHHHHFVCVGCGNTEKIEVKPLEALFAEVGERCEIIGHQFEIFGYCPECRDKGGKINED